jgi:hypothetical protein
MANFRTVRGNKATDLDGRDNLYVHCVERATGGCRTSSFMDNDNGVNVEDIICSAKSILVVTLRYDYFMI